MTFYRNLTRQRTLNSIREFDTKDNDLKHSMSNFAKSPRAAKFFNCFEIREDYCTILGRGSKNNRSKSIKIPKPLLLHDTSNRECHRECCPNLKKHIHNKGSYSNEQKYNCEEKRYREEKDDCRYEQAMNESESGSYVNVYNSQGSMDIVYKSPDTLDVVMDSLNGSKGGMSMPGFEDILRTSHQKQKPVSLKDFDKEESHSSSETSGLSKTSSSKECFIHESLSSRE